VQVAPINRFKELNNFLSQIYAYAVLFPFWKYARNSPRIFSGFGDGKIKQNEEIEKVFRLYLG
jgi:hypothetical protein